MAINLNDNLKINVGNPIDSRYLNTGNTAYVSVSAVTATTGGGIAISQRYKGLTVLVESGGTNIEYWFKNGVGNSDLVEKKYDSEIPSGDFVTGATNLGFFSGFTGVQTLTIGTNLLDPLLSGFTGLYDSLYNYYYIGADQTLHIGAPYDGFFRRGYVKNPNSPLAESWVWNDYSGVTAVGWIFIKGNAENLTDGSTISSYPSSIPYLQTEWTGYTNNGSDVTINGVSGSLTGGTKITIGGPVYSKKEDNNLLLRTIKTQTPEILEVSYDEAFIYLSGSSESLGGQNVGTGSQVFSGRTGNTFIYRTIKGSGDTIVSQTDDEVVIYSSGGTGTVTYDLDSPSVCATGGMCVGTVLTGKTAFELFEEILVPVQNPTLTAPSVVTSLSCSGTLEIGTTIFPSLSVTSTYNAGCINPQYTATSDCRSCGVIGYCFTSTGGQVDGYYACTTSPVVKTASSYVVSAGTQTWGTCACHCAGVQPYDSKGDIYNTPLTESCTVVNNKTITGILPWYWGTKKVTNVINGADVAAGTCIVANANGTLPITYNSAADDYLWFAVPNGTDNKISWFVCASNQGSIGGTANLFAVACNVTVTSSLGCWAGCTFDVYASCFTTGTASGVPMCMIP